MQFNLLNCITGVDYFEPDPKKAAKAGFEPHLELVYHLSSVIKKHSLVLKVMLPRWKDDQPGELPEVPTVTGVWRTADIRFSRNAGPPSGRSAKRCPASVNRG